MAKKGKLKKAFLALGLVLALTPALVGCSNYKMEKADEISTKITHVMQEENINYNDASVTQFKLIGADVAKTAFEFGVKFNGVAELSNGENAFATAEYKVPSEYFINLKKKSSEEDVFKVLDRIVSEIKVSKCTVTPVKDLSETSDAFVKNSPSPFNKYSIDEGMVYNITPPTFDDTNKTVTFEVKTLMELVKNKSKPGWGVGIGFDGTIAFGYGVPITMTQARGTFTTLDKYTFQVDDNIYEQMKNDPKMVYDYVVNAINSKDRSKVDADRLLTSDVAYNESDLLNLVTIDSLEEGLSK
ncbi:MAG: hypothetical protein IJ008_01980 [Clostridia bacterium]|nr:hypothetical protein [Clostridia bacterium]